MGRSKSEERVKGAELFVCSTMTLKEVADIIKVSAAKVGQWAIEDKWKEQRNARQATAEMIIANYYSMIAADQQKALDEKRSLTNAEMDRLHKMADSIEKLKKKLNIGTYHMILTEFAKDLMDRDVAAAKILAPLMLEFMKDKVKQMQDA